MNVNLTPQLESFIKQKIASGFYNTASEIVREALRLLEERDRIRAIKLEHLRHDVHDGIESGGSR